MEREIRRMRKGAERAKVIITCKRLILKEGHFQDFKTYRLVQTGGFFLVLLVFWIVHFPDFTTFLLHEGLGNFGHGGSVRHTGGSISILVEGGASTGTTAWV